MSETACRVCGRVVPSATGHARREMHSECKNYRNFLDAAHRSMKLIAFAPNSKGSERALIMRQELFAMANELPIQRHKRRGKDGRFVSV